LDLPCDIKLVFGRKITFAPDLTGELTALPQTPIALFRGLLLKGGKRRAEEGRERRGRGEERRGEDVRGGETERGERREGARPLPREEKEKSAPIFSNITVM